METAAREVNLTDLAQRVEKIIHEANAIWERIESAADTLRGLRPMDGQNSAQCPEPGGLVPLLATKLSALENLQHNQRQALNRLFDGLREEPPPTALDGQKSPYLPQQALGRLR